MIVRLYTVLSIVQIQRMKTPLWDSNFITVRRGGINGCEKVGAILNKSVNWSETDTLLHGESIGKVIVLLQISEVLSDEAIQVLLCKKFESEKWLYRFKPQNF